MAANIQLRRVSAVTSLPIPSVMTLNKQQTVIGRDKSNADFVLDSTVFKAMISRKHAIITRSSNDIFEIEDQKSVNGVYVNGVRTTGKVQLHVGDVVVFGDMKGRSEFAYLVETVSSASPAKRPLDESLSQATPQPANLHVASSEVPEAPAKRIRSEPTLHATVSATLDYAPPVTKRALIPDLSEAPDHKRVHSVAAESLAHAAELMPPPEAREVLKPVQSAVPETARLETSVSVVKSEPSIETASVAVTAGAETADTAGPADSDDAMTGIDFGGIISDDDSEEVAPVQDLEVSTKPVDDEYSQALVSLTELITKQLYPILHPKASDPLTVFAPPQRMTAWQEEFENIKKLTAPPQTIVGVIGDTGAGKSSLLNALLGEESVLPTNGMRACTASVVEASFNPKCADGKKFVPGGAYEAEIHFLSEAEWLQELKLLLTDVIDENGRITVSTDRSPDMRTEAGVAYAKIKAVYGQIDTLENLLRQRDITHNLGTVKTIKCHEAKEFREAINKFVDSSTKEKSKHGKKKPKKPRNTGPKQPKRAHWPIVKRVCIRGPWRVLESGAILVDLPGVRDANVARARVAQDYLKRCSTVWVVANITRAVDDKTAKDLLGENFRRQMLMDGQYGSCAFICTKTDDLKASEVISSLGVDTICQTTGTSLEKFQQMDDELVALEDQIAPLAEEEAELQQDIEKINKKLVKADDKRDDFKTREASLSLRLIEETEKGDFESKKKKSGSGDDAADSEESSDSDSNGEMTVREQVDHLHDQQRRLSGAIKQLRAEKVAKTAQLEKVQTELWPMQKQLELLEKERRVLCALARNEYSTKTIQEDFLAGIEEMREMAAAGDDTVPQDIDVDVAREVAAKLPVFCVSSTDSLKLSGKLKGEGPPMFMQQEDTQMPKLRNHLVELTQKRRRAVAMHLARVVSQFLASVATYLSDSGTGDQDIRERVRPLFDAQVRDLSAKLRDVTEKFRDGVTGLLKTNLEPRLKHGITAAEKQALATVNKWGAPMNREDRQKGGLHFGTYRATCVRDGGPWRSPTFGDIDFNDQLAAPIFNAVSVAWDTLMNTDLPARVQQVKQLVMSALGQWFQQLKSAMLSLGIGSDRIDRVVAQATKEQDVSLTNVLVTLEEFIRDQQREISRSIVPQVQSRMQPAYDLAGGERGVGTFFRMKAHLISHTTANCSQLFSGSCVQLLTDIGGLIKELLTNILKAQSGLVRDLQKKFRALLGNAVAQQHGENCCCSTAHGTGCRSSSRL
eukprot:TRINITY_DN9456_c0_g2_i1.p1 TRINITY_DN9456_c0_g2~~TRINITY_DN9456_c0_g2_i1.p1  ORF type:complete len:1253 (-),score=282.11 TRINITY_DN9456_c0_g2_i1:1602-5360(-)